MADKSRARGENARWRGDEGEGGRGEINDLTSGWSVHLCVEDRLQIGRDIQEHLGHQTTFLSLLRPPDTTTRRHFQQLCCLKVYFLNSVIAGTENKVTKPTMNGVAYLHGDSVPE